MSKIKTGGKPNLRSLKTQTSRGISLIGGSSLTGVMTGGSAPTQTRAAFSISCLHLAGRYCNRPSSIASIAKSGWEDVENYLDCQRDGQFIGLFG